ncbi:MAG: 50S ribosomal protein L9 [Deltaproteobacteria bacterium]|nr:50S ribosomal protein L9 [Deltaproteobacteria bacterium]
MKVILKAEVDNLGKFGDLVKVAPGYARNYLIPKGFAAEATTGNIKQFEAEREAYLKKAQVKRENSEKLKTELEGVTLTFTRKAGEDDKLFGSVTTHDIETELKAKGFAIERKEIRLEEPIKSIGQFTVSVRLQSDVIANINVGVVKE